MLDPMVARRQIGWPQICDGKGIEGEVPRLYRVRGSYVTYLVGRDGRIAAKNVHGERLRQTVAKLVDP